MRLDLILLSYITLFVLGLCDNIRGPVYPEILRQFSLNHTVGSVFFTMTSIMTCISGFFAQYLVRRYGELATLRASLIFMLISQIGVYGSSHFYWILVFAFFLGVSFGIMGVAQNTLVIRSSPPGQVQKWQSGLHSMYGAASFLAPLLISFLFWKNLNWRLGFAVSAGFTLLIFVLSYIIKSGLPLEVHNPSTHQEGQNRKEIFVACILSLYVAFELMVSTRLAVFVQTLYGFDGTAASFLTSGFFVFMFAGRLLFIFWRPSLSVPTQLSLSLVASVILTVIGLWGNPWILSLVGLAMAPAYPLAMTWAGELFPGSVARVTSYAIAISGIFVVIMHSMVGLLADHVGLQLALLVGPVMGLLAVFLIPIAKLSLAKMQAARSF